MINWVVKHFQLHVQLGIPPAVINFTKDSNSQYLSAEIKPLLLLSQSKWHTKLSVIDRQLSNLQTGVC